MDAHRFDDVRQDVSWKESRANSRRLSFAEHQTSKVNLRNGEEAMFKLTSEKRNPGSKLFALLPLMLMPISFTSGIALAQSPHFLSASASGPDSDGNLIVSFKEAGLGNNALIAYAANADATATYACINGGGNHPKATNKETVNGPVTATGTFSSGKNGSISQSLTLEPPSPGSFSCPGGQTLVLASVSYTNVTITDTTNGVTEDIPGTFARVFFKF
jgi:hypothetical protein